MSVLNVNLQRLLDASLVRRLLETGFSAGCRRHLAVLDRAAPARLQLRALLGLVHHARSTSFARHHDFGRIRTIADFRRLVPVRSAADFASLPAADRPVCLTPQLLQTHRRALLTTFALALYARPHWRPLEGRIFWLPEEAAAGRFPLPLDHAVRTASSRERPSCIIGPAEQVVAFLEARSASEGLASSRSRFGLPSIFYTRRDGSFSRDRLRELVGDALLLETVFRPEGPLAVEDPRHGSLRLLVDHGIYFEFLPPEHSGKVRLGIDEVQTGVPYEVAVTSPAGLWACKSGVTVCFDQLAPPLVRVVPTVPRTGIAKQPTLRAAAPELPVPGPHRQTVGSLAAHPGTASHTPW